MKLPPSVQRLATVDYCDGLGIAVGSHTVSFVHSTKRLFQVGLKETRTVPLPETAADHLPAIRRALTDFLADIETLPDQTVLCLPPHRGERQPAGRAGSRARLAGTGRPL